MGRKCSVCVHPERESIDSAIVEGEANRAIARRFGLSKDAVARHAEKHLPTALVEAHEANESTRVDDLWTRINGLIAEAEALLKHGKKTCDARAWASGIREARACLELLAKVEVARLGAMPQMDLGEYQQLRAFRDELGAIAAIDNEELERVVGAVGLPSATD